MFRGEPTCSVLDLDDGIFSETDKVTQVCALRVRPWPFRGGGVGRTLLVCLTTVWVDILTKSGNTLRDKHIRDKSEENECAAYEQGGDRCRNGGSCITASENSWCEVAWFSFGGLKTVEDSAFRFSGEQSLVRGMKFQIWFWMDSPVMQWGWEQKLQTKEATRKSDDQKVIFSQIWRFLLMSMSWMYFLWFNKSFCDHDVFGLGLGSEMVPGNNSFFRCINGICNELRFWERRALFSLYFSLHNCVLVHFPTVFLFSSSGCPYLKSSLFCSLGELLWLLSHGVPASFLRNGK